MKGKWLGLVILALVVSACYPMPIWKINILDGPPDMDEQTYPPLYVEGWKAGCETGISAQTNNYYKFQYKWKQDWELAQNVVYYKGWKDAFNYCQRYINQQTSRKLF